MRVLSSIRGRRSLSNDTSRGEGRTVAIVVIGHSQWPTLQKHIQRVVEAVNAATPGSYVEVDVPLPPKKPFTRPCTTSPPPTAPEPSGTPTPSSNSTPCPDGTTAPFNSLRLPPPYGPALEQLRRLTRRRRQLVTSLLEWHQRLGEPTILNQDEYTPCH